MSKTNDEWLDSLSISDLLKNQLANNPQMYANYKKKQAQAVPQVHKNKSLYSQIPKNINTNLLKMSPEERAFIIKDIAEQRSPTNSTAKLLERGNSYDPDLVPKSELKARSYATQQLSQPMNMTESIANKFYPDSTFIRRKNDYSQITNDKSFLGGQPHTYDINGKPTSFISNKLNNFDTYENDGLKATKTYTSPQGKVQSIRVNQGPRTDIGENIFNTLSSAAKGARSGFMKANLPKLDNYLRNAAGPAAQVREGIGHSGNLELLSNPRAPTAGLIGSIARKFGYKKGGHVKICKESRRCKTDDFRKCFD